MRCRAFTLTELVFVVIIVGILVTMALPGFARTTDRAQQRQAWDMLQTIYASEQVFFSVNNRYSNSWVPPANPGDPPTLGNYMDDPDTPQITYTLTSTDSFATTFGAEANGRCNGTTMTMTINQTRTMGGTPSTPTYPNGWLDCPMGGL